MKYNDVERWSKLKNKYRVVNYYENNSVSKMNPNKIYELDYEMMNCKRDLFTGRAKTQGNIGVMELDGTIYYSHSGTHTENEISYMNFKGDKNRLILLSSNRIFKTSFIGKNDRMFDSEAKLFEFAATIVSDKKNTI